MLAMFSDISPAPNPSPLRDHGDLPDHEANEAGEDDPERAWVHDGTVSDVRNCCDARQGDEDHYARFAYRGESILLHEPAPFPTPSNPGAEPPRRAAERSAPAPSYSSRLRLRTNIDDIHFGTRAMSMGAVHA